MSRRLLPTPWLSLALLLLWLLLNRSTALGHWLIGGVLAVAVPLLTASLRPSPVRLRRPLVALRLFGTVLFDVLHSNLVVARGVWRAKRHPPHSAFIELPLELRDSAGLAAFAVILCIIPGTVWCDLSPDRRVMTLHVFDLAEEAELVEQLKTRYEQPLREIFE